MVLGFRSRWVDQIGDATTTVGGEILRACGNAGYASTRWTLEENGVCGGKLTVNPPAATDPWTGGSQAAQAIARVPMALNIISGDDGFEGEAAQGSLIQMEGTPFLYATQWCVGDRIASLA